MKPLVIATAIVGIGLGTLVGRCAKADDVTQVGEGMYVVEREGRLYLCQYTQCDQLNIGTRVPTSGTPPDSIVIAPPPRRPE